MAVRQAKQSTLTLPRTLTLTLCLAGQAVYRGYNVLSLDTDLHLAANPLNLLRRPPYAPFSAIMQLDSGWAVEGTAEGQAPTDERGQHVNIVPCRAHAHAHVAGGAGAAYGCPCGVAPAPLLNTGFVYVRADTPLTTTLPQLVYNRTVEKILSRLARPPNHDNKRKVDPHAVWAQDVVNEVVAELASLPPVPAPVPVPVADGAIRAPHCHRKDTSCAKRPLSAQDGRDAKRRWWLPRASHSVWLATHQAAPPSGTAVADVVVLPAARGGDGGGGRAAPSIAVPVTAAAAPVCVAPSSHHDRQLVLYTQLRTPSAAAVAAAGSVSGGGGAGGGASALPFLPLPRIQVPPLTAVAPSGAVPVPVVPTLAALPREAVGRLCGARISLDTAWLRRAPPVGCADLDGGARSFFGQEVLHMQFTHADTRMAILKALYWWRAPPAAATIAAAGSAAGAATTPRSLSCPALVAAGGSGLAGVVVSSALAPSALLCLLPGAQPDQSVALPLPSVDNPTACPCCWRVDALQQALAQGAAGGGLIASSPQAAAAEDKALRRAARYSGCRIWRRYA